MTEKRITIEQKNFEDKFGFERDYRATVGSLKKALEEFDDDLPIGVSFDTGFGYCDIYELLLEDEDGLIFIRGD